MVGNHVSCKQWVFTRKQSRWGKMGRCWNLQSPRKRFALYVLSKISLADKMYPSGMKAWHFPSRLNKDSRPPPLGRWSWEEIREMWPQALTSPVSILPLISPLHIISLPKKLSIAIHPGLPHCRWILYQLSHRRSPRTLSDQGLNPGLPHCRQILYQLSYQGSHSHK